MDSTMYGLLGSGGENIGLDMTGLLGNGQPPQQHFGMPGTMPGGAPQGGVQPLPNAQPGMGGMQNPTTTPMPQAPSPMTSAPTGLFSGLNPQAGAPGGATPQGAAPGAGMTPQQMAGLNGAMGLMQAGMPHTAAPSAPSMLGGGGGMMQQSQALSGIAGALRNLYGGGMGNGTA